MSTLEERLCAIEARNARVEADKAWETSALRRASILALTYFVAVVFLFVIRASKPLTSALVPVIGFWLSTLTLPILKKWWFERHAK